MVVDNARHQCESLGIDGLGRPGERACGGHRCDTALRNCHVGVARLGAGSINQQRPANQQISHRDLLKPCTTG